MQPGDERLLLEHEAGHDRSDRERRERQGEAPPPDRGVPGEQTDRGDQQRAQQQGGRAGQGRQPEQRAGGQLGGQQRPEPGVAGDAQGDLAAVAGDDHQGQEDQRKGRHGEGVTQVRGSEGEGSQEQRRAAQLPEHVTALIGRAGWAGRRRAAAGEAAGGTGVPAELTQAGDHQQQNEQRGHEQVGLHGEKQRGESAGHLELAQLALQDADGQRGYDRTRHAGQAGGDDHRERFQDQQREPVRSEL